MRHHIAYWFRDIEGACSVIDTDGVSFETWMMLTLVSTISHLGEIVRVDGVVPDPHDARLLEREQPVTAGD